MRQKPIFKIACLAIMAAGAISAAGQLRFSYPSISQILFSSGNDGTEMLATAEPKPTASVVLPKTESKREDVSDEIIFFVLFNHLVGLKEEAEKVSARGGSLDYLKLYEEQANLNGSQSELLFQTAQDCIDAIKPINQEAKEIIAKARASFPNGKASSPQDIPEAPKELVALQKRKDETILRFRDVLRDGLGAGKFSEFDSFAKQKIAPQIVTNLTEKEEK